MAKPGRPSKADLAARSAAEEEMNRRVANRAGSFAAVLYDFLRDNSPNFEEEPGVEPDASAAASYLREYVETLHNLERGLPPLPSAPDAGPWSLVERDALDVSTNEPFSHIAERYGVNVKSLYTWSKKRRWKQRRALLLELQARQSTAAALVKHAQAVPAKPSETDQKSDEDEARELQDLVRRCIRVFEAALENGQVQFKSARDMETLIKLLGWLQGRADKIIEHNHNITVKDLEVVVTRIVKRMNFTPEMAGVVTDADYTLVGQPEPEPAVLESGRGTPPSEEN